FDANSPTVLANFFDSVFQGCGLAPEAAKPPIGLTPARNATDAGENLRFFTSAAKYCRTVLVAGLRSKSMVMPASSCTSLRTRASVSGGGSRPSPLALTDAR